MRLRLPLIALLLAPLAADASPMEFDDVLLDGNFDGALGVESGDLNGDGIPDLVATAHAGNQVKVWLSPTPTSMSSSTVVSVGAKPGWPRLRDIDRDGDLDIFVGSYGADELYWLENDGSGGGWVSHLVSTDQNPFAVELGDVDGDGDEDLIVGSYDTSSQYLRWYENLDGVGGSWSAATTISASPFEAWHLSVVDFDKDGHLDVLATDEVGEEIRWWLNDGDATGWATTDALAFPATSYPQKATAFDMDRDGDLDIVCSFSLGDSLEWFENDGSFGTWTAHQIATPNGGQEARLVDLDLDGDVDIVGTAMTDNDVEFHENLDGLGGSWSTDDIESNLGTGVRAAVFDWEGDGDLDLAVTAHFLDDVRIYQNLSLHGRTWGWSDGGITYGANPRATAVIDFDGDGDLDFFGSGTSDVYLGMNDGTGSFAIHTLTTGTATYWAVTAGDIDGDGDIDVATIQNNSQQVMWLENDGSLTAWPVHAVHSTGGTTYGRDIEVADLDYDGDLDIISADGGQNDLLVHLNGDGVGGSWTPVIVDASYGNVDSVEVVDFNRDGYLDLVSGADNANEVGLWLGDGSGTSWTHQLIASINDAHEAAPVDIDFDGDYDLVVTDGTNGNVLLLTNAGDDVTFTQTTIGSGLSRAPHAVPVDLDKDGDYDVVASGYNEVVAFMQDGGTWGSAIQLRVGNTVIDGGVGDFDLDGDIDVLYPDIGEDRWFLTRNEWAHARATVTDQVPADPTPGATGVLLSSLVLEGGQQVTEAALTFSGSVSLFAQDLGGTPLTQAEVAAVFGAIDVWVDDGDGAFDATLDTLDASETSFVVNGGVFEVLLSDVALAANGEETLWVTADIGADASAMSVQDLYLGVSFAGGATDSYGRALTVLDEDAPTFLTIDAGSPPTAILDGPYAADEGDSVLVDATGSTDADGDIATYAFDCDGDGVFEVSQVTTGTYCVWPDDGTYTVSLRVTDSAGNTSTTTTTATVANVAPALAILGAASVQEGVPEGYSLLVSDPGDDTVTAWLWTLTDENEATIDTSTSANPQFTFPDDGLYTLEVEATDEDGTHLTMLQVMAANVPPTLSTSGPAVADEGAAQSWTATVADVAADTVTVSWEMTLLGAATPAVTATGLTISLVAPDNGLYLVTASATDEDGGLSLNTTPVIVSNVAPTVVIAGASAAVEGGSEAYSATVTDPGDDTVTAWDWTLLDAAGATLDSSTSATPTFTFASEGAHTVAVTVTDEDGTWTTSQGVTVGNAAPTVTITSADPAVDEGASANFVATASDPGGDTVTVNWELSLNGTIVDAATGLSVSLTPPDEGTYDVVATAEDGDGGTATAAETLTVSNVAPVITSAATTSVTEGSVWAYEPSATDPGSDVLTWTTSGAPGGLSTPTATGAVEWTPAFADVGSHTFTLEVSDGDGGADAETITLTVSYLDADSDGMPDTWEAANGLDPTTDDAALDPDADGITNLDEWLEGWDPQVYDGPTAPVATSPVFGAEVATATPVLTWDNAEDPDEDVLTYDVEVWADATLTVLLDATTALAEDPSGSTSWTPSSGPAENAVGYWRVRASDPYVDGPWTNLEFFTVNATEEAPGVPVASAPLTGDSVSSTTPTLSWLAPTDPDGDAVTYDVTIWDAAGTAVVEDVVGIGSTSWAPVNPLSEDTTYQWEVQAVDDTGLTSGWSTAESFFVDTSNNAPSDVAWVSPLTGDAIEPTSPTLEVTVSLDPEGGVVTYQWELDRVSTFDSTELVTGSGTAETWDLSVDAVVLTENVDWHARARTQDADGAASAWQSVEFFVRGPNDAPGAPSLVAPVDEALFGPEDPAPALVAGHVVDPEGDAVTYGFVLARDEALTDVVASVAGLDAGAGAQGTADQTSWTPDVAELDAGVYYWAATATDDGGASATSEVWSFEVEEPAGDDDDSAGDDDDSAGDDDDSAGDDDDSVGDDDDSVGDDDDSSDGGSSGCDCESSVAGSGATTGGTLSILCLLVLARRRRRTPAGPVAP